MKFVDKYNKLQRLIAISLGLFFALSCSVFASSFESEDIRKAEIAFLDGRHDVSEECAVRILRKSSPLKERLAAFNILMAIDSKENKPSERIKRLESHKLPKALSSKNLRIAEDEKLFFDECVGYWLAIAYSDDGQHQKAVEILKSVLDSFSNVDDYLGIQIARQLSYDALLCGDFSSAINYLDEAKKRFSERNNEYLSLLVLDKVSLLIANQRVDEAKEELEQLVGNNHNNELDKKIVLSKAVLKYANEDVKAAVALIESSGVLTNAVVGLSDVDSRINSLYSELLIQEGTNNFEKALVYADRSISLGSSALVKLEAASSRIYILAKIGNTEVVKEELGKLLRSVPNSAILANTIYKIERCYYEAENYKEALEICNLYLRHFVGKTNETDIRFDRAKILTQLEMYEQAARGYLSIANADVRLGQKNIAYYAAGESYMKCGLHKFAVLAFSEIDKSIVEHKDLYEKADLMMAECFATYDKKSAVSMYEKIAEDTSENHIYTQALFSAAELSYDIGEADKAIEIYEKLCASSDRLGKGDDIKAYLGKGLMLYKKRDFEGANEAFDVVLKSDFPELVEHAECMKIAVCFAMNKVEEAYELAKLFLEKYESSQWRSNVYFWLGKYDFSNRDYAKAEEHFVKYYEKWPSNSLTQTALLLATYSMSEQKKFSEVISYTEKFLADNPKGNLVNEIRFIRADAMCELLQFDSATKLYRLIYEEDMDGQLGMRALGRSADCLYTLGADNIARYEEAISVYKELLDKNSQNMLPSFKMQACYKIGKCYEKMGEMKEALKQYYEGVILRIEVDSGVSSMDAISSYLKATNCAVWYSRAIMESVSIYEKMEDGESIKNAIELLKRLMGTSLPMADEAAKTYERIILLHNAFINEE